MASSSMRMSLLLLLLLVCLTTVVQGEVNTDQIFKCPTGKFKCGNGEKCIPQQWKCDGDDDCGDRSDESGCAESKCKAESEFTCASNNKCVPKRWKCDGEKDCSDGSDEQDCKKPTCASNFFQCKNLKCVPEKWKCDKQDDCGDRSDEEGCPTQTTNDTCNKEKEFTCTDGTCIALKLQCDGEKDCPDGADERNCSSKVRKCEAGRFQCENKQQCIPIKWKCDGNTDCYDLSDEKNCGKRTKKCDEKLFWTCDNGDCIKKDWRCDGEGDCTDSSDEKNCTSITCQRSMFQCVKDKKCIPSSLRCNNASDCTDGSDEVGCGTTLLQCDHTHFNCSSTRRECVEMDKVCDGTKHCLNGEDEPKNCGINECKDNNGHCSHNCTDLTIGYECSCRPGFTLDDDLRTCTDVDECQSYGTCHQTCVNLKGHYKCGCGAGFQLEPDRKTCKPEGMPEWIYFSNRVDIRRVSPDGRHYEIVVSGIRGAVSIDFDMQRKRIYWTDILSDQIQSADIATGAGRRLIWNAGRNKSVVMKHVHTPDGLALDWINDKLYWTDTGYKTIEVSDLDGKHNMDVVEVGLNEPRAIAVDPFQGYVYWTDWGSTACIERISMDGDEETREKVVDKNIYWPNGLTLDLNQESGSNKGKIYWVDAKLKRLEVCDMDGGNRKILKSTGFKHPFAIDNFAENIFWTDWKSDKLTSLSKFDNNKINIIKNGLFAPMDIKVYHKSKQPSGKNRCDGHQCSHLCLLANTKGTPTARCKCPRGMTLQGLTQCEGTHRPHTGRHDRNKPTPPSHKKLVTPQRQLTPTQNPDIQVVPGKSRSLGGGGNTGGLGTGGVVGVVVVAMAAVFVVVGLLWYRRKYHSNKTNVKYYKDMSRKPLEDDFDIGTDDLDDMAQIDHDSYGSDPYSVVQT